MIEWSSFDKIKEATCPVIYEGRDCSEEKVADHVKLYTGPENLCKKLHENLGYARLSNLQFLSILLKRNIASTKELTVLELFSLLRMYDGKKSE